MITVCLILNGTHLEEVNFRFKKTEAYASVFYS